MFAAHLARLDEDLDVQVLQFDVDLSEFDFGFFELTHTFAARIRLAACIGEVVSDEHVLFPVFELVELYEIEQAVQSLRVL